MNKTIIKNISYLLIVFAGMFLMQSCTDEIPRVLEGKVLSLETKSLSLSANSVYFDSFEKSSRSVTVRAENMEWEFTDIPEWLSVSPASGVGETDVRIEVSENPNAVNRVGLLTFRSVGGAWNYSMAFTVSQFRAPYSISLPVDTIQVLSESTTRTVQVDANTDTWTIIIPESMSWCTARKAEGGMVITADENKSAETRKGAIELHTDDVCAYLTVTQHPAGVKTVNDGVGFPVEGGSQSMGVNVSASWSIENTYSWIDVKTMSGDAGFANLPIEVTPNFDLKSRDGFIYIVIAQDNKIAIPVHQEGISFSVDRSISVPSVDYTSRLNIRSNMPWRFCVDSIPDWITVDPESGSGSMQVIVKTKSNRAMRPRTSSLPIDILTQDGSSLLGHTSVEVSQEAFTFGADSSALYFSDTAGNMSFNIKSADYWSAHSKESWISLSPDDGRGNSQMQVSVSENMDSTARIGSVILMTDGHRDTISVYQAGKFINVSSKALSFQSRKDSVAVSLSANGPWTASATVSWIDLSATDGDGNCDISITVQDNPFNSSRVGEVIVSRGGNNPVRISVRQAGRYLTLSSNYIVFFEKGGASEPITVQTDGIYSIQTTFDWITISKETESQFTLTASENTGSDSRTGTVLVYLTDLTSGVLQRTISVVQGTHFEAEYVDLGLSVYWATCNVGATTPEGYGNYYAWGEVYVNSRHNWLYYRWCNGTQSTLTKYNSYVDYGNNGFVDYKTSLDSHDDVASVMWGEDWRMPTKDEFDELMNNCFWEWTTQGGVNGYKITSGIPGYTDRSIFLPAAGAMYGANSSPSNRGREGFYWQSDVSLCPYHSWNVYIRSAFFSVGDDGRPNGYTIRPVKPSTVADAVSVILSRTAMSIKVGETDTILATIKQNYEIIGHDVQWSSSDGNIAIISPTGVVEGVAPGMCTLTATFGSTQVECSVNVVPSSVTPEVVDLGLSVNWASFNVGADRPEGAGEYFAWGDIDSKSSYNLITYKYCDGSDYINYTKYCDNSSWGIVDNKKILEPDDDIATTYWGEDWRMPTTMEVDELIQNCTWTWTSLNGVEGYRVTSNVPGHTDCSIFLPAAGVRGVDKQMGVGFNGQYWTASCEDAGWVAAWKLYFNKSTASVNAENRFYGYPIRPVTKKTSQTSTMSIPDPVDLGLNVMWAPYNVGASSPEKDGFYYAWAETTPKISYNSSTYKWYSDNKYNTNLNSSDVSSLEYIELVDDPANVNWGGNWRMPTNEDFAELWANCDCISEIYNGVFGWTMKSRINGNSIFIPASGVKQETSVVGSGQYCYMFTSDMYYYTDKYGYYYYWWNKNDASNNSFSRFTGVVVRPVYPHSDEWFASLSVSMAKDNKKVLVNGSAALNVVVKNDNEVIKHSVKWSSDDPSVATVDQNGVVTGVSVGTAHITASVMSLSAQCTVTVVQDTDVEPEYVDLGLSVKWATFNVGALEPEDYGSYYAWGEVNTKSNYVWTNYKYRNNGDSYDNVKFNKYNTDSSYGAVDNKTTLDPEDDVAHVIWGGTWRMPTSDEQDELRNNCTWTWYESGNTEFNGVAGYKVTRDEEGYTGRFIFFPAAGGRNNTSLYNVGSYGIYWSSTLCSYDMCGAWNLGFDSGRFYGYDYRYYGHSVRPVCP